MYRWVIRISPLDRQPGQAGYGRLDYSNFKSGTVYLTRARQTFQVPFQNLSDEDQDYVPPKAQGGRQDGRDSRRRSRHVFNAERRAGARHDGRAHLDRYGRPSSQWSLRGTNAKESANPFRQRRQVAIPFSRFSESDQNYVRDVLAGKIAPESLQVQPNQVLAGDNVPANLFEATETQSGGTPRASQRLSRDQPGFEQPHGNGKNNSQADQQGLERQAAEQHSTLQSQTPESTAGPYQCSRCKAVLTGEYKAGDKCPNCATYFHSVRDASGTTSTGPFYQSLFLLAPGENGVVFQLGFCCYIGEASALSSERRLNPGRKLALKRSKSPGRCPAVNNEARSSNVAARLAGQQKCGTGEFIGPSPAIEGRARGQGIMLFLAKDRHRHYRHRFSEPPAAACDQGRVACEIE